MPGGTTGQDGPRAAGPPRTGSGLRAAARLLPLLLSAAEDERIRAVASLSGWADLAVSRPRAAP
ncbi:hypothetical protein [Nocardiopsis sp. HUAS JQ3]|uniref:hypothetical protein n=1 Tax=Nocardiopsis sp. HUAS JQ3 TaxID=3061629 RepID=UPI0023A92502|nr:hypothetical protein [Nocardiopsis sp. HUAS JQ3]WDZ94100.1 hypothetical protein PV789_22790 [Nocardiopsis sp. HUAS JQ3]